MNDTVMLLFCLILYSLPFPAVRHIGGGLSVTNNDCGRFKKTIFDKDRTDTFAKIKGNLVY